MKDIPGGAGPKSRRGGPADLLGPNSEIGRKLREYFTELEAPSVPDRFDALLSQLEKAEQSSKASSDSDKKA